MSETKWYANFRGAITALIGDGKQLLFATEHAEGCPTAVVSLDVDKGTTASTPFECGATAGALIDGTLWIAGTDRALYSGKPGKALKQVGEVFGRRIVALVGCAGGVAVVEGGQLHVVDAKGKRETFELEERGSSVASDTSGNWLVVGTDRGQLCVFDGTSGKFVEAARERVHDGAVTALAFAPDELRVYSAGGDQRLLLSFVRGAFDTEDRGGNNGHSGAVTSLLIGPEFATAEGSNPRFFTAGSDRTIKSWPRSRQGSQRPASFTDGVVATTALALVTRDGAPHLAAAGNDGTVRLFGFDEQGRVDRHVATLFDAYADARRLLGADKPKDREKAFNALAGYDDAVSLKLLADHLRNVEQDSKLLAHGVELLTTTKHASSVAILRGLLAHGNATVRITALESLRTKETDQQSLLADAIAQSTYEDVALAAVGMALAEGTSDARALLIDALDNGQPAVRSAAVSALEAAYGDDPFGTLLVLQSGSADVRRLGIARALARSRYGDAKVAAQLRRLWDHDDERVRLASFVVSMHRSEALVKALRAADADFHRQLFELEQLALEESKRKKSPPAAKAFPAKNLSESDLRLLVEAVGARKADVSLRAASSLAVFEDVRALGTLLQLSRAASADIRLGVCRALAALGDPRSIERLRAMLDDDEQQVRDGAFDALAGLHAAQPLDLVRAGLAVQATDVRERALAALAKVEPRDSAVEALFARALNDGESAVRQQAFKAVFNAGIGGGGVDTLRFARQSIFADVRSEALDEALSKPKDKGYRAVVVEFFADGDASIREAAFDAAIENAPSAELAAVYEAGLSAPDAELRLRVVQKLAEAKDEKLRAQLPKALDDADERVRGAVIEQLVAARQLDLLLKLLANEHEDVRLSAATAIAQIGDMRSVPPLVAVIERYLALVEAQGLTEEIERARERARVAVAGLATIGAPGTAPTVFKLVADPALAGAASEALPFIVHPDNVEEVRALTQHASQEVRYNAALAVTFSGDPRYAGVTWTPPESHLLCALALRDEVDMLVARADESMWISNRAMTFILAHELTEHVRGGAPERLVALLAAKHPKVRLNAAAALELYGDQPAFYRWVYEQLNAVPGDDQVASPEQLLALSRAVTLGAPRLRIRAGLTLLALAKDAKLFEERYARLQYVYGDELKRLEEVANRPKPEPLSDRIAAAWNRVKAKAKGLAGEPSTFGEALTALAFGAYVGLSREETASDVRVSALLGLERLAAVSDRYRADAEAALLVALGDPAQNVQTRAFAALEGLGFNADLLIAEAMSTTSHALWSMALDLMARVGGGDEEIERVIRQSSNADLVFEAQKVLTDRTDDVRAWTVAVQSASARARTQAISLLGARSAGDERARQALVEALSGDRQHVRFEAAVALGSRGFSEAYDVLAAELRDEQASGRAVALETLTKLRDPRTPALLEELVEHETTLASAMLAYFGSQRDVAHFPMLLRLIDEGKHRDAAFGAALQVTGYDYQEVEQAPADQLLLRYFFRRLPSGLPERVELRPELLAELFDLTARMAWTERLGVLIQRSRLAPPNTELDEVLASLTKFSDANVRMRAIEIAGSRLKDREGPAASLKEALKSREPLDQFYAAEGLAQAGHGDGLSVLRAAITTLSDDLRARAILAIGALGDESSLELLLSIATNEDDGARAAACEAIGHMSKGPRADEVFAQLQQTVETDAGYYYVVREAQYSSLRGLRWFGTPAAWALLREYSMADSWDIANIAVEQLRHDPASVEKVKEVLTTYEDSDVAQTAYESLAYMLGAESLEPDYLVLESPVQPNVVAEAMQRLRERGDAGRLLDTITRVDEEMAANYIPALLTMVLSRDPLPFDEAAARLSDRQPQVAEVAARVVGRGGADVAKKHGAAVVAGAKAQRAAWDAAWKALRANHSDAQEKIDACAPVYQRFVWALGQLQVGADEVVSAATLPDHPATAPVRHAAVVLLGEPWVGKAGVATLQQIASGKDAGLRALAAAELERLAPAERVKWLGMSRDEVAFGRVAASLDEAAARESWRGAIDRLGGVALPQLARLQDVDGLLAAARDEKLSEHTRRGALDALGTIPSAVVADALAKFGADEAQDEALRKAAWRARRRVTRAVTAQETT